MKAHAKYSASASARWLACPGSIKRSEEAPPQKESAAATEGTAAHELMEFALNLNIKDVVNFFKNDEEKYSLEMREHVQDFVTWVRNQIKKGDEFLVEEKTDCHFINPDMGGTVDVAIVEHFGTLHIIDFKYGVGYVDHINNPQMIQYSLGIAHKFNYNFETVKTTIYQPRGGEEVARSFAMPIEELLVWKEKFTEAVNACENADKEKDLNPGAHCKYCPAKINCPAITTKALAKAKLVFSEAAPILPPPKELTPAQLIQVLNAAEYLELWVDEVKSYAENYLAEGKKLHGWTLVPTRPSRMWSNEKDLLAQASDPSSLAAFCFKSEVRCLSPAQAEKALKACKVPKDKIEKFLKDNVTSVSSGVKLSKQ